MRKSKRPLLVHYWSLKLERGLRFLNFPRRKSMRPLMLLSGWGRVNMSLTEAVDFAIKHSRPDAGVISVEEAIEKALETKRSKRPSYSV
jgi:hypothetical protein